MKGAKAVVLTCLVAMCTWTAHGQEIDLSGTRKGPTGFFLTMKEREALRERVSNEPWAKEYFEKEILPACEKGIGFHAADPMALATAYVVTRDSAYAMRARDLIFYYLNNWYHLPEKYRWGEGKTLPRTGGSFAWGSYLPQWLPRAYDLIADALSPEDELFIRRGIKDQIECARNYYCKYWYHTLNMKTCSISFMIEWACAIGDDAYVDWLINHKPGPPDGARWQGGFVWLMDNYIRDGNLPVCYGNETSCYSWIVGFGLPRIADAMIRYRGQNFYEFRSSTGASIKSFMDGIIATAYPVEQMGVGKGTIRVASWGHGSTGWGDAQADVFLTDNIGGGPMFGGGDTMSFSKPLKRLARAYPKERSYRWYHSLNPGAGKPEFNDFLYGPLDSAASQGAADLVPPPAPCSLMPESGIVMLRSPDTSRYWQEGIACWLHGGEKSRANPGQRILFHGANRLLYPEWLQMQYESWNVGWSMRRVSNNTLVIDGREGLWSCSTFRHSWDPEVKFASVRYNPYLEAEEERALMLTDEYMLDVNHARVLPEPAERRNFHPLGGSVYWGANASLSEDLIVHPGQHRYDAYWRARKMPESHTFDYMIHGLGKQFPDSPDLYHESSEFATSFFPNRWVENERKRETDNSFMVDWVQTSAGLRTQLPMYLSHIPRNLWRALGPEWYAGRAGVRMRMLGDKGTDVFLGEGPMRWGPVDRDLHPEEVIPLVAVRRKGKNALFVALHEPYRDEPAIRDFKWFCKPQAGDANPVVGVEVQGPDAGGYRDRLFICLGLDGLKLGPKTTKADRLLAGVRQLADITGGWLFQVDPDQKGDAQKWFAPSFSRDGWQKVSTKTGWQSFRKGYYGTAWYARTFTVPSGARAKKPKLFFYGADQHAWIFVNGKLLAEHHDWAEPFFVELGDAVDYGSENLLVAKVRKLSSATGLYGGVKIVAEDGKPDEAPGGNPKAAPLVTARSDSDPDEWVRFSGQAYVRTANGRMTARGAIEAFSLAAPQVREVILNAKKAPWKRMGAYVVFGAPAVARGTGAVRLVPLGKTTLFPGESTAVRGTFESPKAESVPGVKVLLELPEGFRAEPGEAVLAGGDGGARFRVTAGPGAKVGVESAVTARAGGTKSRPLFLTVASPVALSFPQRCPNLDAERGGELIVRVRNVSNGPVSGRVVLSRAGGLTAAPREALIKALAPGKCQEVAFALKADANLRGKLVPLSAQFFLTTGFWRQNSVSRVETQVAVGTVVEDVKEQYTGRVDHNKFQTDVYDRLRVRTPGYTIEIDKSSGTSRWVMDPQGKVRTTLGAYPSLKTRGAIPYTRPYHVLEIPAVFAPGTRTKVFGWDQKATFLGQSTGPAGEPVLSFRSADGKNELVWSLPPDRVELSVKAPQGGKAPHMKLSKVDVEESEYAYRIELAKDGFAFRRALAEVKPQEEPADQAAESAGPVNVMENGTFAELGPGGKYHPDRMFPTGWRFMTRHYKPVAPTAVELDEETCVTGGRSLRFNLEKLRGEPVFLQQHGIPVKAHKRYRIKIRMRHENVKGGAPDPGGYGMSMYRLWFKAPGATYQIAGSHPGYYPSHWPGGTRGWFTYEFLHPIGEPATRWGPIKKDGPMLIWLFIPNSPDQSGTLWIDEIICEELP